MNYAGVIPEQVSAGMLKSMPFWIALLTAGCGSVPNANLGPDPGGGFYCPHNIYIGCVNP